MVEALANLEGGLQRSGGAGERLRQFVQRTDEYMREQQPPQPQYLPSPGFSSNHTGVFGESMLPSSSNSNSPETSQNVFDTKLFEFQLPNDLLSEWPWPYDATLNSKFPRLGSE